MSRACRAGFFVSITFVAAAAGQSVQPLVVPVPVDAKVEAILDRLEQRGTTVGDLTSRISWTIEDTRVFEKTTKEGTLRFLKRKPHSVFRVDFDRLLDSDGTEKLRKETHVFDGRHYIEAKAFTKTVIRREIVREGEETDPFELGAGRFPLPFGQKKADILKHFVVELVAAKPGDPPNCDHLKCVPRPASHLAEDYRELHFYVHRRIELPVRVVAHQKKDGKIITVDFKKMKLNTGLAGSRLELKRGDIPPGWEWDEQPLPPRAGRAGG